jgi:hypothetical protein
MVPPMATQVTMYLRGLFITQMKNESMVV